VNPDEDGFLYHYTNLEALTGIIINRTMWATHIRYLNDTSEQTLLRDALKARVRASPMIRGFFDRTPEQLQADLDIDLQPVFVSCFSADRGDRLSQWRAYGASGVCLQFDKAKLAEFCNRSTSASGSLYAVTYVDPKGGIELAHRINMALSTLASRTARSKLPDLLSSVGAVLKHIAFKEEKEWRLLSHRFEIHKLKHRARGSLLVPYIDFDFADGLNEVIAEVIVGPTAHREQTAEAIMSLLAEHGFTTTNVRCSETPYRGF
jgi:Protein of unknown function (DUF2971)